MKIVKHCFEKIGESYVRIGRDRELAFDYKCKQCDGVFSTTNLKKIKKKDWENKVLPCKDELIKSVMVM